MIKDANIPVVVHDGNVVSAEGTKVRVKIFSISACAQCHARGVCGAADMKEKIIEAVSRKPLQVGDTVIIIMEEKLGLRAVLYSFVLPFVVMVTVLFAARALGSSEGAAAFSGIGSLLPYYLVLYTSRKKIEKTFVFRAEKKNHTNKLLNTSKT